MSDPIYRRNFLQISSTLPLAATAQSQPTSVRHFLAKLAYKREDVSIFLDKAQQNWAKFDPELNHFFAFAVKDAIAGWLDPKRACGWLLISAADR